MNGDHWCEMHGWNTCGCNLPLFGRVTYYPCYDCQKSTAGRCPFHAQQNPFIIPNPQPVFTVKLTTPPKSWECHKCGRVYAPHVDECRNCNG